MPDMSAHESRPAAGSRPIFQASPRNPAMSLFILGAIAGAGAALLLYSGVNAIDMGGIAVLFGIGLALVAIFLLVASGVFYLLRSAFERRNAPR